jgi:2-polyprenyl-6-methoxyphenol hydroxylase-like FAD-dependent oxidoreductase
MDILIVGAGFAGLLLALECKRLGFSPVVLERSHRSEPAGTSGCVEQLYFDFLLYTGDFVVIGPSAVKVFRHWPSLNDHYYQQSSDCVTYYNRHSGQRMLGPVPFAKSAGRPMLRRDLQSLLEEAVQQHHIPVRYSQKVVSYFEEDGKAGVAFADGKRLTAEFVAACDGVHSRSWNVVTGVKHEPVSSGQAVFRTSVPAEPLYAAHPELKKKFACDDGMPYIQWFVGPKTHATIFVNDKEVCWSIHHPVSLLFSCAAV